MPQKPKRNVTLLPRQNTAAHFHMIFLRAQIYATQLIDQVNSHKNCVFHVQYIWGQTATNGASL